MDNELAAHVYVELAKGLMRRLGFCLSGVMRLFVVDTHFSWTSCITYLFCGLFSQVTKCWWAYFSLAILRKFIYTTQNVIKMETTLQLFLCDWNWACFACIISGLAEVEVVFWCRMHSCERSRVKALPASTSVQIC